MFYYGARYYDPVLSRWISVDPPISKGEYFPTGNKDRDANLPGMGGVYNTVNQDAYHYAGNNPVKLLDPDGNSSIYLTTVEGDRGTSALAAQPQTADLRNELTSNLQDKGAPQRGEPAMASQLSNWLTNRSGGRVNQTLSPWRNNNVTWDPADWRHSSNTTQRGHKCHFYFGIRRRD